MQNKQYNFELVVDKKIIEGTWNHLSLYMLWYHLNTFNLPCLAYISDLVDEYQQYQEATVDDDDEEEEEDYEYSNE